MKKKMRTELHAKTRVELKKQLAEARNALFQQQLDLRMNSLKNQSNVSVKRDEIAVLLTILGEKEREEQHDKNA